MELTWNKYLTKKFKNKQINKWYNMAQVNIMGGYSIVLTIFLRLILSCGELFNVSLIFY